MARAKLTAEQAAERDAKKAAKAAERTIEQVDFNRISKKVLPVVGRFLESGNVDTFNKHMEMVCELQGITPAEYAATAKLQDA